MDSRERVRLASPDSELLQRAQSFLEEAERPLIIAGNGAVRTDATARLREFVETTAIPVASTYIGKRGDFGSFATVVAQTVVARYSCRRRHSEAYIAVRLLEKLRHGLRAQPA
ncbi:hypothetical protein [Halobellus salinisoli]|uniref:hypothetical protein n=1 Tax=Halobellus salinisoli TaxID=3108500 RepID=UPI00300BB611